MKKITNEADYDQVMAKIDYLMSKGSNNISKRRIIGNSHFGPIGSGL